MIWFPGSQWLLLVIRSRWPLWLPGPCGPHGILNRMAPLGGPGNFESPWSLWLTDPYASLAPMAPLGDPDNLVPWTSMAPLDDPLPLTPVAPLPIWLPWPLQCLLVIRSPGPYGSLASMAPMAPWLR